MYSKEPTKTAKTAKKKKRWIIERIISGEKKKRMLKKGEK